ncbi:T-cell receptor gamma chain C region 5/10-13 [Vulpes lagopus]
MNITDQGLRGPIRRNQFALFPVFHKPLGSSGEHAHNKTCKDFCSMPLGIPEELTAINSTKTDDDILQLQLKTTSAYYTYLLLFLKSLMYSIITAFCLFRRPAPCGNGKSPNTWWHQRTGLQTPGQTETSTLHQEQILP